MTVAVRTGAHQALGVHATQAEILARLAPAATSYLEVGVQEGRSLRTVLAHAPALRRIALCDTWGSESGGSGRGSHAHIEPLLAGVDAQVVYLDGDSRKLLPELARNLAVCAYDLVHVDGGHAFDVVASDLFHGWRLCRIWLVVHDISFTEVWQALCQFIQTIRGAELDVYFGGHGTAVLWRVAP